MFVGDELRLSPSEEWILLPLSTLAGDRGTTCRAASCCRRTRALALVCASAALGVRSDQATESGESQSLLGECVAMTVLPIQEAKEGLAKGAVVECFR